MSRSQIALGVLVGAVLGIMIGARLPRLPPVGQATVRHDAGIGAVRVDLHLVPRGDRPAPWMVVVHERGWPAPDDKERSSVAIADAMQRRGIAVAVLSFDPRPPSAATPSPEPKTCWPLRRCGEQVADAIRDLGLRAQEYGIVPEPILAGDEMGASLVALLALDARAGLAPMKVRGVIAMNGVYDAAPSDPPENADAAAAKYVRADAPPFLVLAAPGDSPRAAQSSRTFTRALERAGAKDVHGHYVSTRDARSLSNLSGDRNDVGDLVAAFARGEPTPGGPEGPWALGDTWGARAPLTTEAFWSDARLIVRRPADTRFRAHVRSVFGEMMRDLDPWPASTYDAIDLGDYLHAHTELGSGDWLVVTNARGEQIVLPRTEIDRMKPVIVVGIDDEKNLFRLFVTYNVHRTYSWKAETEPRPLLVRSIGAFLYLPAEPDAGAHDAAGGGPLHVITMANFALTPSSFRVVDKDPLGPARATPKPVLAVLTNEQGCLQCHALRGSGARAHHVRASDGKLAEAFALPLEEYPRDVLRRFPFDQDEVAKSFGVGALKVSEATATALLTDVSR